MNLPYDPEIPFLGVFAGEMKTYVHPKICIQVLIAALCITATGRNNGVVINW